MDQPVNTVVWVPIYKIIANDYNPNLVAESEMHLLYLSIKHDGYTQPIVTVYDKENDKYIIVDGFHRYLVMKNNLDIYDSTGGLLPIVIIDKDVNDRMASTIRHNRARGKHLIDGMSNVIFNMLEKGWSDERICNELGMEPEEILRLKHITGFSKLFKDHKYNNAWETKKQLELKKQYYEKHLWQHEQRYDRKHIEAAQKKLKLKNNKNKTTEVICPYCLKEFEIS